MKNFGIIIIVLGLLFTIFSGINFKREDTIVELGDYELSREKEETFNWPPWVGVAIMAAGVGVVLIGKKK